MDPSEFKRRAQRVLQPSSQNRLPESVTSDDLSTSHDRRVIAAFLKGAASMFTLMAVIAGIAGWLGHNEVFASNVVQPIITFVLAPIVVGLVNAARKSREGED